MYFKARFHLYLFVSYTSINRYIWNDWRRFCYLLHLIILGYQHLTLFLYKRANNQNQMRNRLFLFYSCEIIRLHITIAD